MKLKLKKIGLWSFVRIFSALQVVTGFFLGIGIAIASFLNPGDPSFGPGAWSILLFPVLNGLLGLAVAALLAVLYNLFAQWFGPMELEFEQEA